MNWKACLLYLYICLIDRHTHFVFTCRKISCHRFQQFTVYMHAYILTCCCFLSLCTHRYFQFNGKTVKKNHVNWNRQRVFTCRRTCRIVNIWFEHALLCFASKRNSLALNEFENLRRAGESNESKRTLCLHLSICRSSKRAEHNTLKDRQVWMCACLCTMTWSLDSSSSSSLHYYAFVTGSMFAVFVNKTVTTD